MACTVCEETIKNGDLDSKEYALMSEEAFSELIGNHPSFVAYSDFSNGVSEGGNGLICSDCMTFLDVHYSMYSDENTVSLNKQPLLSDIQEAAHMLVLQEKAKILDESLKQNGKQRFYFTSDLYVPFTFGDTSFKPLEILQRFGKNHPVYGDYASLHLSLGDAIPRRGSNDSYTKTTFILSVELDSAHIEIRTTPNPYGDAQISLITELPIPPDQLVLVNLMDNTETPLPLVSLEECENRDNEAYLAHIRMLQDSQAKNTDSSFELSVKSKIAQIQKVHQPKQ